MIFSGKILWGVEDSPMHTHILSLRRTLLQSLGWAGQGAPQAWELDEALACPEEPRTLGPGGGVIPRAWGRLKAKTQGACGGLPNHRGQELLLQSPVWECQSKHEPGGARCRLGLEQLWEPQALSFRLEVARGGAGWAG